MRNRLVMPAMLVLPFFAGATDAAQARTLPAYGQLAGCSAATVSDCLRVRMVRQHVRSIRTTHRRRVHVARSENTRCGGRLSVVRASSGATACIASSAASHFQAFVAALEATGYRIDFMGGWRAHGTCRYCNMHPRGLALDINQTGRNRITHRFPSGVTALAASYGLLHGAVWSNPDTGHFELLSASPTRLAYQGRLGALSASYRLTKATERHARGAVTLQASGSVAITTDGSAPHATDASAPNGTKTSAVQESGSASAPQVTDASALKASGNADAGP